MTKEKAVFRFVPNQFTFFASFRNHSALLRRAVELIADLLAGIDEPVGSRYAEIRALEKEGDEILRNTIRDLDRQLSDLPPKQDTLRAFRYLDRILDHLEVIAGRLSVSKPGRAPGAAIQLGNIMASCQDVMEAAIETFGEGRFAGDQIAAMADLENEADEVYIEGLRELFARETEPTRLLQMNEIYGLLERAVNLFDDCLQVLEESSLKGL